MAADPTMTLTAWATVAAAAAGFLAAIGTGGLAAATWRLGNLTRTMTVHEQEQLDLLRRDRDMRLRPVLEFHGCRVIEGAGPRREAILTVSNHGQGLAVNAYCTCECTDERPGECLVRGPYVSERVSHIPPGAEHREIELQPPVESGLHAAFLEPTPGVSSVSLGGQQYAVFCLDETGRKLYRFLFGQPTVDMWEAGEPAPGWAIELLRRVPELKPDGADLNRLLNP